MVTGAKIGYGTTLSWGDTPPGPAVVVELTRIGSVSLVATKVDATTLNRADAYKEILPGLIDPGDVAIEGLFRPDDPGQIALLADMESRTPRAFTIAFPTALSTTTWSGTAYITGFVAGDATPEGIIPFSATLSIRGRPILGVTAGEVLTGLALKGDITGAPVATIPAFDGAVYAYTWDGTAENTFTVKPTCTAADSITVNGNTVISGAESSPIETLPDALVEVTVITKKAGRSDKIYTITVFGGL